MVARIQQLSDDLKRMVQEKELEITEIINDVPPIISIMEQGFIELKNIVSDYRFPSVADEIKFFKYTKPILFSKLIFLRKIYQLELNLPVSNYSTVKTYLEREHEQINVFSNKNADFIQYYRSGKNILDEYYFLRDRHEIELNLESFYFERDPKFSTNFDFKVAKLLSNDLFAAYLNCELAKLKQQENNFEIITGIQSKEKWTDTKVALVELIYAVHSALSINSGKIDIKVLACMFSKLFNIDLGDIYHVFLEIRSRKGDRTVYLNRLIKALNMRMEEADSK